MKAEAGRTGAVARMDRIPSGRETIVVLLDGMCEF